MHPAVDNTEAVLDWLCEQFPEASQEKGLKDFIGQQLLVAGEFGLKSQPACAAYVGVAWLTGSDFATAFPEAQEILRDERTPGDLKAHWLIRWCATMFANTWNAR